MGGPPEPPALRGKHVRKRPDARAATLHDGPVSVHPTAPMKTIASLAATACIALAQPSASARPTADDVAAILEAEAQICAAFERGDADWLETHLDPTFTLVSSTGRITTRAEEIADLRAGTRYDVFRNRDSRVRVYADAAVVTGITRVEGRADGKPYALDFRFTDTYVRRPRGWVMVASHASKLAR